MDNYDLIAQFAKEMMEKAGLDLPKSDPSKGGQAVAYVQAIADVARQYADANPDLVISDVALGVAAPYRVAVKKGDPKNLLPIINAAIEKAEKAGLLNTWMDEAIKLSGDAE